MKKKRKMVTLLAQKAKRYSRADLVPGETFKADARDVETLKLLGWATDPPPRKAGTYVTAALRTE